MEARDDIYEVWLQYMQTNDEGHFREFTRGFVATWENQLGLDWVQFPTVEESKSDLGPHLSRLPEELLPAIGRFLINSDHSSKKLIKCENIRQTHELVRCLIILSRNFDNIPFIASCDFVGLLVGFAAAIIHQLVEGEVAEFQFAEEAKGFVTRVCRLLECLYDPYFSWRAFLQEKPWTKTQLPFQPALLHVEVIPFLYDCFETCISTVAPELSSELIHVLGAVVSGAQNVAVWLAPSEQPEKLETAPKEEGHNGLRAICPATVNVVLDSVVAAQSSPGLRCVSLRCFVAMVHTLQRSAPDQRQIEVGTMFQQFREAMHDLADFVWAPPRSEPSTPDVAKQVSLDPVSPDTSQHLPCSEGLVCELVLTLQRVLSLDPASNSAIADVLVENRIQDSLLDLLYRVESRSVYEKQAISVECVKALTGMLGASARGRAKLQQDGSYSRLFSAIQTQGCPSRELLQALLEMSSTPTGDELSDVEPLLLLMRWLPEISRTDQFWLAVAVHQLCTASVQSKCLACENQLLNAVSQTLGQHSELDREAAFELIRIVESLASLSISAVELKQLFMLLRDDTGADRFPYHVQLLHAVSSVARREDLVECHSYFDIQNDSDGIVVPGIKRWPGTGYGISFHVWLRLNEEEPSEPSASSNRRQLFNMSTGTGSGVEMFLLTNGALAVAILSKKEFLVATVPDQRIQDGHWHCVTVCHMAARRPFGQNQLAVYIDGHQRLTAALKFPPTMDPFTSCYIGCPCLSSKNAMDDEKSGKSGGSLMLGAVGSFLPSIVSHVPNYFTLPLRSSSSHSNPHDPNVKSYPLGMQDNIYGPQTRLGGQLALAALFHEALSYQQVRTLYEAGPSCRPLFSVEEGMEQADITTRLVLCYSAAATHQGRVLDLSPGAKYEARCSAPVRRTLSIKVSINGLGGVHVLLPILQMACSPSTTDVASYSPDLAPPPLLQRRNSTPGLGRRVSESIVSPEELDDWEVLPSSSYSDWKLEQNPVSGFLSLLRNVLTRSPGNQDNLLKNNGVGIVGDMLTKVRPRLIDVHVLMAVQLLVEMARDTPNQLLLRALHHHILFNFHIWARSQFHIRIGHIQYICTVVKEDRRSYRRRYGVQFVLDTVRQFHGSSLSAATASEGPDVCLEGAPTPDDARTLRGALLGLVKYYLQKEVNVREVNALLGFLSSVKEEILVIEVLEMLTSHIESASCRDQLLLLLYEPQAAETLYCLLLDRNFSHTLKHKVLKLFSVLLRSERVYERHKTRLRLQDATLPNVGLYPGVLSLLDASDFTMELAMMLLDQILLTDVSSSYAGALALLHALSSAPLEVKLEAARKILTTTFMRNTAAQQFAKQVGWQECITRLLVKRPILDGGHSKEDKLPRPGNEGPLQNLPDLMSFDEENLELIASERERPASPSNVSRISATVSDAASALETEIKEVAETVAGNIHFAADNISSVVASAYSAFRQKTYEMQDSLEEFGATARSRLKRHSLTSLQDALAESGNSPGPNFLLPTHDLDSLSLSNRSSCSSSNEDLTSRPESSASIAPDRIVESSQDDSTDHISSEEQLINQAMEQWRALDAGRLGDREEELCYLVVNILFTVMWRGIEGASKEAWKERGQVLACINLLGLNNELYCSHLELKRRLLEMAMQASVSDLRDESAAGTLASNSENGAQLLRWTYDLVVLDMHGDPSKKCSCKLLDGVLGLIDALLVFQDAPAEEWTEMAKLAFGILLSCAGFADVELVAMATAKLHDLVQTRHMSDPEETAYLLCYLDSIVQKSLQGAQPEHYSFVLPVVKALLAKTPMLQTRLPGLPDTQSGPAFFESFQAYAQTPEWRVLLDDKLKPLYKSYQAALLGEFSDGMNIFWAECYEASKIALQRRARELADSRLRFQSLVMAAFKTRQVEDTARVAGLQVQRRSELLQVRRSWRQTRRFLTGTRGAWRAR